MGEDWPERIACEGPEKDPPWVDQWSTTIMKKFAVTVAVLALGVAACQDNAADNNVSAVNTIEEEAAADTNAAAAAADEALNDTANLGDAAANVADNAEDAADNAL
jgi:hypothetical protein